MKTSMLSIIAIVMVTGCAELNYGMTVATDKMCTVEGLSARLAFRVAQDANFDLQDKAICVRCPGEAALSCTGEPKALPAAL